MKTLYLLRHAKAFSDDPRLQDIDKPLSDEGKVEAEKMGQLLRNREVSTDLILTSPAKRAQTTTNIVAEFISFSKSDVVQEARIYENTVESLMDVLHELDDDVETVMLVGHNPSFSLLAQQLSDNPAINMPTCGICVIKILQDSWSDLGFHRSEFLWQNP